MDDRPTVLFVDDEPALADGHAAQLSDRYDTRTAYDSRSAIETVDDAIDVVFLDRRMPGTRGEAILESIREEGYDCRVVMLTGVEPDVDVVEMGFDEYLLKPTGADELRETVDRLLAEPGAAVDDDVLDALGDAKTRRCCYALAEEPLSAQELADATGYSLTTVYRRLNALRQADLITSQVELNAQGDHYETFTVVPTRIEIEIADDGRVDVDRLDARTI